MAIEFIQAQKKQRYLILILTLVICATLLVIWQGFFQEPAPAIPTPVLPEVAPAKIEINLGILDDQKLANLKIFEQISTTTDEIGRENPFAPY